MTMNASDFSTLKISESSDRLWVRLHRPEVRNAIDQQMVDELHAVCSYLERVPKILILAGTPGQAPTEDKPKGSKGIFASGADIAQLRERRRDDALAGINSSIFDRIAKLPMPVIAALDGYALGGGAELAYAADFRLGTEALRMGNPETNLGIMAAAGATWRLKELVGEPAAKEILLAGKVLTGSECLAVGLITELHDAAQLDGAVDALADRIGAQDPLAVRITKAVFHSPREVHPVIDTLAQGMLFESQAKFDRMQSFLDRKKK
ncbi:enoyl-CoA hydratase/isomerase family protein [Glutamicibacter bergerei]|uniref:Enoyl-CoA hydratase/isomerase family protein n=2 Tax=Glutamicibacter TaxID=1742989 RepID=A0ABV9MPB7_9MICC|nr:enoyl-CoA hydratase/isomerase family protein [Glutamicibacter ardleyensis]GGJ59537.1 putative enoyl-CoA hydratase/isomerase [Glutamicibacter ardleyensis]HBV11339.1 enoyl-CoA hydratase [Micrococcaceae bacterium]